MRRSDPKDYELRWQTFLIDGFTEWRAAATIAATQYTKTTPQTILAGMIHDFYFPAGQKQTTEQIVNKLEMFAFASNARVRDPKTGEVIGNYRGLKKKGKQSPAPARQPSKITLERAKRRAARTAAKPESE